MGLTPLPPEQIATVVTTLAMTERPQPAAPLRAPLRLERCGPIDAARYRALFRAVGGPWLWFSRLLLDDAALRRILADPAVEVYAPCRRDGSAVGLLELEFGALPNAHIRYFGLVPEMTGRGIGGWLMAHALRLAWRPGVERLLVDTCTLDHPSALGFYRRHGFVGIGRAIETFADPRLAGLLPPDVAPHVPLLGEPPPDRADRD